GAGEGNRTLVVSLEGLRRPRFSAVFTKFAINEITENVAKLRDWRSVVTAVLPHNKNGPDADQSTEASQRERTAL
ncbi:hypothetical protein AB1K62_14245, partial [Parasphingorhabdus sp. JC815]|uniref:hypothetical protein n=1 Tax=Parasphingorhabdus sp. JC815 TaxID=3232140 RepID=UPI003458FC8F